MPRDCKINKLFSTASILCIVIGILCLVLNRSEYHFIALLPIMYSCLFLSSFGISRFFSYSPGFCMFFVISTFRFFIGPVLVSFSGNYRITYVRNVFLDNYDLASILLLYEMIAVWAAVSIYKSTKRDSNNPVEVIPPKTGIVILVLFVLAIIFVVIDPKILSNYNFVFSMQELQRITYNEASNKLAYLVINTAKNALNVWLIIVAYKRYLQKQTVFSYVSVILMALLSIVFVSGTNRGSVIVPAVTAVFILIQLFPKRQNQILIICGIVVSIIIVLLTIRKSLDNITLSRDSFISWLAYYIDMYYAGIDSIATSLAVKNQEINIISISTLFRDVLYYIPGIGTRIINSQKLSSRMFNRVLFGNIPRGDAVIPSIGQGMIYFGSFFSFIPSVFFVIMALRCDDRIKIERKLWKRYILTMLAVYFGNNYANNVNIISQQVFQVIFPFAFCFLLDDCMVLKMPNFRKR